MNREYEISINHRIIYIEWKQPPEFIFDDTLPSHDPDTKPPSIDWRHLKPKLIINAFIAYFGLMLHLFSEYHSRLECRSSTDTGS